MVASPLLVPLALSFILSSLKFSIKPFDIGNSNNNSSNGIVFSLLSSNRNISFSLKHGFLFADLTQINQNKSDQNLMVSISCLNDFSLNLEVNNDSKTIPSPSLCTPSDDKNRLLIGPDDRELFYGCVHDVTFGSETIVKKWCRNLNDTASSSNPIEIPETLYSDSTIASGVPLQPLYIGETVKVKENEFIALQWKNFYLFPEHRRFRISNTDVIFDVLEPPEHGQLKFGSEKGHVVKSFNYDDFIRKKIYYVNNGDESVEDSFDIQIDIKNTKLDFGNAKQRTYTIKIEVEEKDDPPEIVAGPKGTLVHVAPGVKTLLSEDHLMTYDSDSSTENVFIRVRNAVGGARFTTKNNDTQLTKFSLSDFLNHQVYVSIDPSSGLGSASAEMDAIDSEGMTSSKSVVLRLTASPVEIHLVKNSGIKLLHKSSAIISTQNLSFSLLTGGAGNEVDVPLTYVIVDQPEFGIVECLKPKGEFEVCSTFTQKDLHDRKIRYKQTTENRPKSDVFSFKVEAGDAESAVHDFMLEFIPISLRVFIQESLLLNNSETAKITRSNLLATSFPYNFPRDQLTYHIVEPPKFGMLSRRIGENKNRRIGVSSNFTQEHIDSEAITYKLHFVHYSVVNDFFIFRLITPAVTSELLRFEITYIPGGNSIQLLNRTLIVPEGHSQSITNNTLYLETADDTTFDFTVAIPPFNGNFVLSNPSGSKLILKAGDSFDSFDIINHRLFYEHSDGETKEDRAYLIAESRYRSNTRIPFWFTITVINENNHPPELLDDPTNHVVFLLAKGERTLTPSMFPWKDQDWESKGYRPLSFAFTETSFRDYVFFTKSPSQMAVRTFTSKDLEEGNLVVRDLSLKKSTLMKYTVEDGKHKVAATVKFITDEIAFVRLEKNIIKVPYEISNGLVPISRMDLQAQTNLDFDIGRIQYTVNSPRESPFKLLENGTLKNVGSFYQEDVNNNNLFIFLENNHLELVKVTLRLARLETVASIKLIRDSSVIYFSLQSTVNLGESLVSTIHQSIIDAKGIENPKFTVTAQPKFGSLRIETSHEKLKSIFPSNNFVRGFHLSDVAERKLQYICQRTNEKQLKEGNDGFSYKIHTPKMSFGPFTVIVKRESLTELSLMPSVLIKAHVGSETPINENVFRFSKPSSVSQAAVFRISKHPKLGTISRPNQPGTRISEFDYAQLRHNEVVYSPTSRGGTDSFSIIVCTNENRCGSETSVQIEIEHPNVHAPEIIKNDPLVLFNTNISNLTPQLLNVQDSDSSNENLKYSIWQPLGGFVARKNDPATPINGFTHTDLESNKIVFVSKTNTSGGFSFLVSDGLHQSNPEWFSVEKTSKISLTLEANSRLLAAPLQQSVIGMDLLRAKIPHVAPPQLVYLVSRAPLHGRILLDKKTAVQKFTQADINSRRISYRSDSSKLGAWSQKDYFSFVINVDGKPSIREEFRFKILVTFGALTADNLNQFIKMSNNIQIPVGSSIAFNSSHFNFDALENACGSKLIAEVYRKPTKGQLIFVQDESSDQASNSKEEGASSRLFTNQLASGRHLIYRSDASGNDEIIFHIYPAKEQTKRSSRLRVPFFMEVSPQKSDIEISQFRKEINLVSGGSTNFDPADFQTTSENYSPTEITYTLLQKGNNGVKVVILDSPAEERISFTQAQVNKGQIRFEHTPLSNDDRFDVLVFGIDGGLTKALIIRIEPLALSLFNHTDITYEQGKTYVVLNRHHLGAQSNGDRSKIVYNITKAPQNGTFYWVAGEQEAEWFTQKNIDDGEILYAQLDMDAYQDAFEFTLGNDELEMLQKKSKIVVYPKVESQDLITDAKTITQINIGYLNASALEGTTPRYLVITPPNYGRLFLHPNLNESIIFFTQADVNEGKLFFHAFDVDERVDDELELELRGDSIQPARFKWHVDIRPVDKLARIIEPNSRRDKDETEETNRATPKMAPELNQHLPVLILVGVIAVTVFTLCCKRNSSSKKKKERAAQDAAARDEAALNLNLSGADVRELPPLTETRGAELLDTTVYASVGRARRNTLKDIAEEDSQPSTIRREPSLQQANVNLESFESAPSPPHCKITPLKHPFGSAGSAFKPTPLASIAKGSRSGPITGFKPSSISSPMSQPRGSLDGQQSKLRSHSNAAPLKQNQYWV